MLPSVLPGTTGADTPLPPTPPLPLPLPIAPVGEEGIEEKEEEVKSPGAKKGWAEMSAAVGKGELPSLLAPVELHVRDGEGIGHQVSIGGIEIERGMF